MTNLCRISLLAYWIKKIIMVFVLYRRWYRGKKSAMIDTTASVLTKCSPADTCSWAKATRSIWCYTQSNRYEPNEWSRVDEDVSSAGAHISETEVAAQDLSYRELTDASLIYANFQHGFMHGTSFRRCQIGQLNILWSNSADLTDANLEGCYLSDSMLAFSSLRNAQMNVLLTNLS